LGTHRSDLQSHCRHPSAKWRCPRWSLALRRSGGAPDSRLRSALANRIHSLIAGTPARSGGAPGGRLRSGVVAAPRS
jgi:hypothetical protein